MSIVGLDVGTSRVKAVRFDAAWSEVDSESEDTVVLSAPGGRREQDLDQVWEAVARVLRAVVSRSPDDVDAVAVTAQGDGCWLVDEAGRPVGHALLWNDSRASDLTEQWHRDGTLDQSFRTCGSLGAPGLASAQLRWLAEHEPDRLARAHRLLSCGSWVFSRLTGEAVLERTEAVNPFCDARTGSTPTACSTCSVSPTSATCYRRSCPAPTPCGRSPGPRRTTWASRSARPSCSRRTTW